MTIIFWLSIFLILYTYLVYPLVLSVFFNVGNEQRTANSERRLADDKLPQVTVLVCAHNEEKVIGERVENLLRVDYPKGKLEIIVASDGSSDRTEDIVKSYADKNVKLLGVKQRCGKVGTINRSFDEAKGDIVVMTDANTSFDKDAVTRLVEKFNDKKVGCAVGELHFHKDGVGELEGVYWRFEQFLKKVEGGRGSLLGANGGIYAIRKELFIKLPDNTIVEDFLLPMKILERGYKVVYVPEAVAYEDATQKMVQELERRVRIGAGDFQALTLSWRMLDPRRGFSAFAYFSHKVVRWMVPFLMILAFLANLLLVGMLFYRMLFALQILFYLLAVAGRVLASLHVKAKFVGLPYYFVSMNIGLFFGFLKFCFGAQRVTWKRTDRR